MSNQNPSNVINLKNVAVLGAGIEWCFEWAEVLFKNVTLDLAISGEERIKVSSTNL